MQRQQSPALPTTDASSAATTTDAIATPTSFSTTVYHAAATTAAATLPALQSAAEASGPVIKSAASATAAVVVPLITSAATSLASGATSVSSAAYDYFTKPTSTPTVNTPTTPATAASKGRDISHYAENRTASIALPDTPPKVKPPKSSWFHSLTRSTPSAATIPITPPRTIKQMVLDLQTQCAPLQQKVEAQTITQTEKKQYDQLLLQIMKLTKDEIKIHAEMRVNLFFLACIAVYHTNAVIVDGPTVLQHGKGDKAHGTAGCHAALFSNLQLINPNPTHTLFYECLITTLTDTHLMDSFNITHELHEKVNRFDTHFDGIFGPSIHSIRSLAKLNQVAKGEITPVEAMTEFLRILNDFFEDFERKYLTERSNIKATKETEEVSMFLETYKYIHHLQRKGSLKAAGYMHKSLPSTSAKVNVDMGYIYFMLGAASWTSYLQPTYKHYEKIQKEIASSPSYRLAVQAGKVPTPVKLSKAAKAAAAPASASSATPAKQSKATAPAHAATSVFKPK